MNTCEFCTKDTATVILKQSTTILWICTHCHHSIFSLLEPYAPLPRTHQKSTCTSQESEDRQRTREERSTCTTRQSMEIQGQARERENTKNT